MPRRALRKLSPGLDLSKVLIVPSQLPRPWTARTLFDADAPLEIEVGTGKGLFLTRFAARHPDRVFLGIELSQRYAEYAAGRLAQQDLCNARVVHGDALAVFREHLADGAASAIHVYFPDPWWKARHKKRRVMNEQFVKDIERVLVPGGVLHFWTDVEEYFQTTLALVRAATSLAGPLAVDEAPAEHDLDYRTHFERRTRQAGEPVYRAHFVKRPAE